MDNLMFNPYVKRCSSDCLVVYNQFVMPKECMAATNIVHLNKHRKR